MGKKKRIVKPNYSEYKPDKEHDIPDSSTERVLNFLYEALDLLLFWVDLT